MPVDLLWLSLGFLAGVVGTALALEVAFRRVRNEERATLTRTWDLRGLASDGPPWVVATSLDGVAVPPNSRILVSPGATLPREVARTCKLRIHDGAQGNFAVGSGRGILCTGPMVNGTLALTTVHPNLVSKLERAFESLWVQGKPYMPRVTPAQINGNQGGYVEVQGIVTDVLSAGDKALVRIETKDVDGHGTVVVPSNLPLETGKAYRFSGPVVSEGTRVVVRAESVREVKGRSDVVAPIA